MSDPSASGAALPDIGALFSLAGRTAIVTGGSRGIGRSIARGFAAAGAERRGLEPQGRCLRDGCGRDPRRRADRRSPCPPTWVDWTRSPVSSRPPSQRSAPSTSWSTTPRIRSCSASITSRPRHGARRSTPTCGARSSWSRRRWHTCPQRGGSVINVLSNAAFMYTAHHLLYPVAKAGLAAATRSIAATVAERGVRVNALVPGTIDTDMVRAMPEEFQRVCRRGVVARSRCASRRAHRHGAVAGLRCRQLHDRTHLLRRRRSELPLTASRPGRRAWPQKIAQRGHDRDRLCIGGGWGTSGNDDTAGFARWADGTTPPQSRERDRCRPRCHRSRGIGADDQAGRGARRGVGAFDLSLLR